MRWFVLALASARVGRALGARARDARGLGLGIRRLALGAVARASVGGRLVDLDLVGAAFTLACLAGAVLGGGGGAWALLLSLGGLGLVARAAAVVCHFDWVFGLWEKKGDGRCGIV